MDAEEDLLLKVKIIIVYCMFFILTPPNFVESGLHLAASSEIGGVKLMRSISYGFLLHEMHKKGSAGV